MQQKTICIVSAMFAPSTGGVERFSQNLGKALIELGYQVLILAQNTHGVQEEEMMDGLCVLRFPCHNVLGVPIPRRGRDWKKMNNRVKARSIDAMIVNTRIYPFSLFALQIAKGRGIPTLLLDHSTGHMTLESPFFSALVRVYEHFFTARLKHACKNFYGVSQSSYAWLSHYGIHAKGVLYNAVDSDAIQRMGERLTENIRMTYKVPHGTNLVLYAGRLVAAKGVHKLIAAVQQVNRANGSLFLLVAGEGPLYEELCAIQDTSIEIMGPVEFDRLMGIMWQSDIFVLPTDYPEGFPTSVLEAAATGCYCITTKSGGSCEFITSRDYGVILQKNTQDELQKELEFAIANPAVRQQVSKAAQKRVSEKFTWQTTARQVLTAFTLPWFDAEDKGGKQ